ncbi:MAG: toll/interleukin-1 receptor domain-containing protein [Desulfobacterales bacterium]|nr:MAG: toll/interleukin-1 receptor domain-containing protein [Desulfobacterales bacterium]
MFQKMGATHQGGRMKVFISHSWKDKTTADRLAQNLSSMVDVWLDIQNLRPGDSITPIIDRALAEMDLVIVLWSENSAKSDGVAAEITTALRLKKPLIPCRLDETERDPRIREVLAIEMQNFKVGYGRLLITLLPLLARGIDMDLGDALQNAKDFDGVITYLEEYRNKRGIKGSDKDYWIERVIASCAAAQEKVGRELERTGEGIEALQKIYDEWNAAGDDPEKVQALLNNVVKYEHLNPTTFRQVRAMIAQHLERIKPGRKPAVSASIQLTEKLSTTVSDCRKQISARLRPGFPAAQLDTISELLCEYICKAPSSLEKLEHIAVESTSRAFFATVGFLGDYLENPNDLIPESRYGVWGFLDDAWLIHNTVYRLAEAGIVNINQFDLDWPKIAAADRIVLSLLPPPVLQQLGATMMQFLRFLAAEISGYNPQFFSSGSTYDPFRPYDPAEEERQTAIDLAFSRAGSAANIWG